MRIPLFGILFLLLPILEIATIILVGNAIGLWPTLGLLIGTSILGVMILRWNAASMASKFKQRMDGQATAQGKSTETSMLAGSMRSLGAILMILPGFICKTIGFLFLLPPLQKLLWTKLGSKMQVYRAGPAGGFHYSNQPQHPFRDQGRSGPTVVDLDDDDFERHPNQNSPWYGGKDDDQQKRIE